jgi:hypothetical protein
MKAAALKLGMITAAIVATSSPAWAQASPPPSGPGPISVADLQKRALDRFNALDTNKDGQLTQEELAAGRPARENGTAAPAPAGGPPRGGGGGFMRGMMQGADTNLDGIITSAEFTAAVTARLQQMDANHDGFISMDEIQAARLVQAPQ